MCDTITERLQGKNDERVFRSFLQVLKTNFFLGGGGGARGFRSVT